MAAKAFNLAFYKQLLTEAHPRLPQTEEENEVLIQRVHDLQSRKHISPEERDFMDVLLALIEKFEEAHYALKASAPHDRLWELMRAHGVAPKDLYEVFGSKGTTSEVLRVKQQPRRWPNGSTCQPSCLSEAGPRSDTKRADAEGPALLPRTA
jgi:HTH-type transcriptional regulator / antitoxin HigA